VLPVLLSILASILKDTVINIISKFSDKITKWKIKNDINKQKYIELLTTNNTFLIIEIYHVLLYIILAAGVFITSILIGNNGAFFTSMILLIFYQFCFFKAMYYSTRLDKAIKIIKKQSIVS